MRNIESEKKIEFLMLLSLLDHITFHCPEVFSVASIKLKIEITIEIICKICI